MTLIINLKTQEALVENYHKLHPFAVPSPQLQPSFPVDEESKPTNREKGVILREIHIAPSCNQFHEKRKLTLSLSIEPPQDGQILL